MIDLEANAPKLLDEFAEENALLQAIAPELGVQPLYVLRRPDIVPENPQAAAFAMMHGCPLVRQALIQAGEWSGPGPVVLVEADLAGAELTGVMIHEAAHLLPAKLLPPDCEPTETEMAGGLQKHAIWAEPEPFHEIAPWLNHGADFIRRVLHLHWRACQLGYEVHGADLSIGGPEYGLSAPAAYHWALGDEPSRLRDCTFGEIETADSPREFSDLFAADMQRWRGRRKNVSTQEGSE